MLHRAADTRRLSALPADELEATAGLRVALDEHNACSACASWGPSHGQSRCRKQWRLGAFWAIPHPLLLYAGQMSKHPFPPS